MIVSNTTSTAPTAPPATSLPPGGAMGKNEFLKLLVAQLRHQDPLNPLQGNEMAAELAQFSSLEQLVGINEALSNSQGSDSTLLGMMQTGAAINTIGRTVVAVGDQLAVGKGGASEVSFDVGGAGGNATLRILDSTGREVASRSLGNIGGGRQTVSLGDLTDDLADGVYHFAVDVADSAGNAVNVTTYVRGTVDGISTGSGGLVLNAGPLTIQFANVIEILK
jgi:flagellar basal-body rod modification protein FlgD